ncbi:hypothetical protein JL721_6001 [Aureococcus anophagefferens]|nr:hypothetical protein JL721_6001 [Aureococcus anophagefferens]
MAAPYEGPLRLCDVEGAAQLLSAEWPKQSAESRAKLLRASLDEALPQHVVVVESGAVVARDRAHAALKRAAETRRRTGARCRSSPRRRRRGLGRRVVRLAEAEAAARGLVASGRAGSAGSATGGRAPAPLVRGEAARARGAGPRGGAPEAFAPAPPEREDGDVWMRRRVLDRAPGARACQAALAPRSAAATSRWGVNAQIAEVDPDEAAWAAAAELNLADRLVKTREIEVDGEARGDGAAFRDDRASRFSWTRHGHRFALEERLDLPKGAEAARRFRLSVDDVPFDVGAGGCVATVRGKRRTRGL